MLRLHVRASVRRKELLEECQQLLEAGRQEAASQALQAAEELHELLRRLERAVRPDGPSGSDADSGADPENE